MLVLRRPNVVILQAGGVDAELLLNRGSSEWWSFYDISWLDSNVCGDLMGPMAIVVSEETPRKYVLSWKHSSIYEPVKHQLLIIIISLNLRGTSW